MKYALIASIAFIACLALGMRLLAQSSTPQAGMGSSYPYVAIEQKAKEATVQNQQSIQDLTHQVVTFPHMYQLPEPVVAALETKLATAEMQYRNHQGHAVTDGDLVSFMNWMGDRLHLPAYTKATASQVRSIRVRLALSSPQFMGTTLAGRDLTKGDHLHSEMSPLQAMHVFNVMIDQKLVNPDYQDPSIDLKAADDKHVKDAHGERGASHLTVRSAGSRELEIRKSVSVATDSMGAQDIYEIMNHALDMLHLN